MNCEKLRKLKFLQPKCVKTNQRPKLQFLNCKRVQILRYCLIFFSDPTHNFGGFYEFLKLMIFFRIFKINDSFFDLKREVFFCKIIEMKKSNPEIIFLLLQLKIYFIVKNAEIRKKNITETLYNHLSCDIYSMYNFYF